MTTKVKGTEGVEFPDASVQASAAISAFIGANQSLIENGYQKLPGGLIIQWGAVVKTGDTAQPVSFPIPFTQFLVLTLGLNNPNSPTTLVFTDGGTNTGFNVVAYNNAGSSRVFGSH